MAANPATLPKLDETGKLAKGEAQRIYQAEAKQFRQELATRAETKPATVGRPTTYSDETVTEICRQIAEGRSLTSICKVDGMPDITTVYEWQRKHPEFSQRYAKARQDAADTLADEILRISDELEHATDPIQIQAARLRVESRRWIASRLKPQTWGDKVQAEITGADGAPLPLVTVQFVQPGQKQVEGEVIEAEPVPR